MTSAAMAGSRAGRIRTSVVTWPANGLIQYPITPLRVPMEANDGLSYTSTGVTGTFSVNIWGREVPMTSPDSDSGSHSGALT